MITRNKVVSITYSILDNQGRVAEQHDLPVAYVHGSARGLLPGIESALEGHCPGDRVEIELAPEEGYGVRDESLVFTEAIENVPPQFRRLGAEVVFQNDAGDTKTFYVTQIADGLVTIDGNPSLAGQRVTCVLNVIDVRDATPQEIQSGEPADLQKPQVH